MLPYGTRNSELEVKSCKAVLQALVRHFRANTFKGIRMYPALVLFVICLLSRNLLYVSLPNKLSDAIREQVPCGIGSSGWLAASA